MSQLYIHENLVRIQPLLHKILYRQETVIPTPKPTGSAPKTVCPPSFSGVVCVCVCVGGGGGGGGGGGHKNVKLKIHTKFLADDILKLFFFLFFFLCVFFFFFVFF